jgi:subtilisin family serine protease
MFALGGLAIAAVLGAAMTASPAYAEGTILGLGGPDAVPGRYIVVMKDNGLSAQAISGQAGTLAGRYGGSVDATFTVIPGFSARMSETAAKRLAADPKVAYVQTDMIMSIDATQSPTPSWGLDRIDQRNLPLNNSYTYPTTASGVTAYIIDTGVLTTHNDFGGRASSGIDAVDEDGNATDCHGHGTHVAGTVGGTSFGVAKGVSIVAVRVLNCAGSGTTTDIVQGINFVTAQHVAGDRDVANMSLGGGVNTALDNAVAASISDGTTYAIAAGNSNIDACNFSPARTPAAITLGATQSNDARASFSNFGTCLDLFAPGVSITSAWIGSNTATNTISGTSMASPHACGVAAIILAQNPSFTPQQVRDRMVTDSTPNVVTSPGTGSPNRLLFVNNGGGNPNPPVTVFSDNFEAGTNVWTTNPNGTDTATTGAWERANPETTTSGITLQLGTTASGSFDLVTEGTAGASAGVNDVDGGVTSIRSPNITLPATGTLTLSFNYYLAHLNNATSADFFRVFVNNTQVFQSLGAATNRAGVWTAGSASLNAFAGQTITIRFEAADASTASLIEAGVDDVLVTQQT